MKASSQLVYLTTWLVAATWAAPGRATLVAHYDFNSQTAQDNTVNGNDGTVGAGMSFSNSSPFADGFALQGSGAAGSSGLVDVPNSPSLQGIDDQLTISLWINADSSANANWFRYLRKGDETSASQSWMLNRHSSTQDVNIRIDTAGTGGAHNQNRANASNVVLDGTWRHMAYILDNGSITEITDGVVTASQTYNHGGGFSNTEPLLIAGRGSSNIVGLLDDIGIWDSTLDTGGPLSNSVARAQSIFHLAMKPGLNYDLGEVLQLHDALDAGTPEVVIDGLTWMLVDDGSIGTPEGQVVDTIFNGTPGLSLNLGSGNGFISFVPEPSTGLLFLGGGTALLRMRRRRR